MNKENDTLIEVLTKTILFKNMSHKDILGVISCFNPRVRTYSKGENVCREGELFSGIGVLIEGNITIIKDNFSGTRIILSKLQPSDIFGEVIAFSGAKVWQSTVVSETDSKIMFFTNDLIEGGCDNMCPQHKKLVINLLQIVSSKALAMNKRLELFVLKSTRGKICKFLLSEYSKNNNLIFNLEVNRNELSELLNIPRPSLSRELATMKKEGLIDYYYSTIKILNLKKFENF